jgi:hypothetical protein
MTYNGRAIFRGKWKKIIWAGTKTEANKSIIPFALFVPYMEKTRRNTRRVAGKR